MRFGASKNLVFALAITMVLPVPTVAHAVSGVANVAGVSISLDEISFGSTTVGQNVSQTLGVTLTSGASIPPTPGGFGGGGGGGSSGGSSSNTDPAIRALLIQIEQLKATLANLLVLKGMPVPIDLAPYVSKLTLTRNLYRGFSGPDVMSLQNHLIVNAYLAGGNNTGFFGPLTEAAVQKMQCARGIVCTGNPATTGWGVVGPKTRSALQGLQ